MDRIDNFVPSPIQVHHGVRQEIPSSTLNSRLEDTASDERVALPLTRISVLGMHCNGELFCPPTSGEQLVLRFLPTD